MGNSKWFDLEELVSFYGAYHSNNINVLLHIFFVWPIFFTLLLLFRFTPALYDFSGTGLLPYDLDRTLVLNFGFFYTIFHAMFYVVLDKRAGTLAAVLCIFSWIGACDLATSLGFRGSLKVALLTQVLCWIGQIVGHQVFEKRAPAFQTSFVQAGVTAPFFGLLEVLQRVLDYEPFPGFHVRVQAKVDADIKEWQASKQKKVA